MTKDVIVDDDALRELERGAEWYEGQRAGLGDERLEEVDLVLSALPSGTLRSINVIVQRRGVSVRRVPVNRFPYAVIYIEREEQIDVVAIAHVKRRPLYWQKRLRRVLRAAGETT